MLIIKMGPMEADAVFPYSIETEKPTGEIDHDLVKQIWKQLDANSGPYPEVLSFDNWVVIDCFEELIWTDEHGDELIDCATADIKFVDGTTLQVKFVCTN